MFSLIIYGYNDDIKKISFTGLLRKERKMPLNDAKQTLDEFLSGTPLLFTFNSKNDLLRFKREADLLGTISKPDIHVYVSSSEIHKRRVSGNRTLRKNLKEEKLSSQYSKVLIVR